MKNLSEMWPTFLEWVRNYVDGNTDEDAAKCVYSREDMRYAFQAGYELNKNNEEIEKLKSLFEFAEKELKGDYNWEILKRDLNFPSKDS